MPAVETPVSTFQALKEKIESKTARVGIVGLGYVGLPLAVEFAKAGFHVTGIDLQQSRVDRLMRGESYVQDVPSSEVARTRESRDASTPPPTSPSSASSTPSTSASPRRCARPRTPT